ncbi:carboxypeptidase-like regulatory domain-containing protein [Flavobacteriaceae bacterium 14752]|uniref:carboxypeptidase-like regulatory domain-containing protein n=1 Tax=Mesohalobacter salilacus TaxID=2491711 RepID=UPI000F63BFE8|nr:carboxypeptidase-like regulatory domain-containing protein [Flavobacteriaceae bacterium 14752]
MPTKLIFLFSFIIFVSVCFSQNFAEIQGVTYDKHTGKPLPYVNVMVLNKSMGITTDINGKFSFYSKRIESTDTLFFSHIGYFSKKLQVNNIHNGIINLRPKKIVLDEVKILFDRKINATKITELNKFNKRKTSLVYSKEPFNNEGNLWIPYRDMEPSIETMYFQNNQDDNDFVKLKEVKINIESFKENSKFRLRVFLADSLKRPASEIKLNEPIIEVSNGDSVVNIDVMDDNIYFSENGIFIGVEYLLIEENLTLKKNEEANVEAKLYSPFLKYIRVKEFYEYYIFTKGKWQKIRKAAPNFMNSKDTKKYSYQPAISIKIIE